MSVFVFVYALFVSNTQLTVYLNAILHYQSLYRCKCTEQTVLRAFTKYCFSVCATSIFAFLFILYIIGDSLLISNVCNFLQEGNYK